MNELNWTKEKPLFTEDCLLLTASWNGKYWNYTLFEIIDELGEDKDGSPAWYWSILEDGEEWGDIADLSAELYCVLPLLKNKV